MNKKVIIAVFSIILLIIFLGRFEKDKSSVNTRQTNKITTTPKAKENSLEKISPGEKETVVVDSEKDLPNPPSGYDWHECKGSKTFVIVPNGWHTLNETKEDTQACFITKEKIIGSNMFKTGLSINAIPNIPEKTGASPTKYAEAFFAKAQSTMKVDNYNKTMNGPLKIYSAFMYPQSVVSDKPIVLFQLIAANEETGSIYVVTFESPEDEWDNYSPIVKDTLENLALNNTF